MAIPSFDLIDIIRTIQKQRRFVILIVVLSVGLAGVFLVVKRKKYKAQSSFLVNNPLYSDRSNLFRTRDTRYVDYFGGDDDMDKVTALAYSDTVIDRIIRVSDFYIIYKQDINQPAGHAALMAIFKKNFNIKRTEYKDIEISYIAYDPQTAANVANMSVKVLAEIYGNYYETGKKSVYNSIKTALSQLDKSIDSLTDSLASMKSKVAEGKDAAKIGEEIQNIEPIKAQLVSDRAHYISVMNEFSASADSTMDLLKVITRATPPINPTGAGAGIILLVAGFLGLGFSVLYILVVAYFRKLNAVIR